MATVVREYDAKVDGRDRLVLRESSYEHYHVVEYDDGSYRLEPRILAHPDEISTRTLGMMDTSVENLERGDVGEAVDFSRYEGLLSEADD
jgi:hypothetical protein